MKEPKQAEPQEAEMIEIEQEEDEPKQRRSPWFYVIWAAVILFILAFAIFGITTLMHIPPTVEPDTGFVLPILAYAAPMLLVGVAL